MTTKHTPGPWIVYKPTEYQEGHWRIGQDTITVKQPYVAALRPMPSKNLHQVLKANADRIVACVNACEGINPEAVPMMLEALKATKDAYASHQLYDKCPLPLIKAAIDKAEEKQ